MREAVVERKDDEHHVAFIYADYGVRLLNVRGVVAVRQKDTLRIGGGSGGVADVRKIVRTNRLVASHELLW